MVLPEEKDSDIREKSTAETLEEFAHSGEGEKLEEFLDSLPPGEATHAVSQLTTEDQAKLITSLSPEDAADLLDEIPESQASDILDQLQPGDAASILEELSSDEQADLLQQSEHAEEILAAMEPTEAEEARELIEYPPDVAGGLMRKEYLVFPETHTLAQVIESLAAKSDEYSDYEIQYIYAVNGADLLSGVVPLRELLLKSRELPLSRIMITPPLSVNENTQLDQLIHFFDEHPFVGAPVVNDIGQLVGVIQRRSVDEATADRSDDALLRTKGLVEEELRSMPVLKRCRGRLSWLSLNVVLNLAAASVISFYEDTLRSAISLAVFLPIISDMCGCSGGQAVGVTLRELALGVVRPRDIFRVVFQELKVGIVNGLFLGVLIGLIAIAWKGNVYLGLVVGSALGLATLLAVAVGGSIPLLLKAWKVDPALASTPLLTTFTDLTGFFFALSFATILLKYLTP